jgi:hypothetical protein
MKVNREKKALTFGGLNMAGHNAPSNRRARGFARHAANARPIQFRGQQCFVMQ